MVKMDITNIEYDNQSFDVIYCGHVLEHVQDDRRAMREFHRVLRRNGWAILLVPITAEETFEDPSIVDPKQRLEAFGQEDHVRRYGPDYIDRLCEAGFKVDVAKVEDLVDKDDAIRMGLTLRVGKYTTAQNSMHQLDRRQVFGQALDLIPISSGRLRSSVEVLEVTAGSCGPSCRGSTAKQSGRRSRRTGSPKQLLRVCNTLLKAIKRSGRVC
jgi:SAM-dependent methyltransferase